MGGDIFPSSYDPYVKWFQKWKKEFLDKHSPKKIVFLPKELKTGWRKNKNGTG